MIHTFQATYNQGQIKINEDVDIPDNSTIFVSFNDSLKDDFFLKASEISLDKIWNNSEDDVYEQLLKI